MNIAKRTIHVLSVLSAIGTIGSSAFAGNCEIISRTFVNQDVVDITCKSALGATHGGKGSTAILGSGVKTIFSLKTIGNGLNFVVRGVDATGSTVCQAIDANADGTFDSDTCPSSATRWRAILVHQG